MTALQTHPRMSPNQKPVLNPLTIPHREDSGTEIVVVTPQIAETWLSFTHPGQRPISARHVTWLAYQMSSGAWVYDGSPIVFDTTGQLIQGQHRLHACVFAKTSFKTRVEWGVGTEAMKVMDTGRRRQANDMLTMRNGLTKNTAAVAAACRLIAAWRWDDGLNYLRYGYQITNALVIDAYDAHPSIVDHVSAVYHIGPPKGINRSIAAFCRWLFSQCGGERGAGFVDQVLLGADLKADSPQFSLRRRLEVLHSGQQKDRIDLVAMWIKAWNSYAKNVPCKLVRYTSEEDFPLPVKLA